MRRDTPSPAVKADPQWRIGIVCSSFYEEEIAGLTEGALRTLQEAGISPDHIQVYEVPGSFEIPLIGAALAQEEAVDALIGLGIIVEGETQHARLLAEQTTAGLMQVQLAYGLPFAFEVLYVQDLAQARARSGADGNKGAEAAYAVLQSLSLLNSIRAGAIE